MPWWPCIAHQHKLVLTASPIVLQLLTFGTASGSSLAFGLSRTLALPGVWCPATPVLFVLPPCEPGALCTPEQHSLGGSVHADECMFHSLGKWKENCVCFILWENEKRIFFTFIDLPPIQPRMIFWQCVAGFLPRYFFSASGCQVLLTTVEAPSIYTILRSPWN